MLAKDVRMIQVSILPKSSLIRIPTSVTMYNHISDHRLYSSLSTKVVICISGTGVQQVVGLMMGLD